MLIDKLGEELPGGGFQGGMGGSLISLPWGTACFLSIGPKVADGL